MIDKALKWSLSLSLLKKVENNRKNCTDQNANDKQSFFSGNQCHWLLKLEGLFSETHMVRYTTVGMSTSFWNQ